jgi:hypothetical protein
VILSESTSRSDRAIVLDSWPRWIVVINAPTDPLSAVPAFSAAQLHATVPNTTTRKRFSIDFRPVNLDDLISGRSAPNIDSACTGPTLRDFLRATDLEPLPDEVVERHTSVQVSVEL